MNSLLQAGLEFQAFLLAQKWRFAFIGGLAVARWGEPRLTEDIDLCLFTGFGAEADYARLLTRQFTPRIPDAFDFALINRVVLLKASNGVPADIALAGIGFEERLVERATPFTFAPGCSLITCSAEDLLVLKAFADRPQDWLDVEAILARQGKALDTTYAIEELRPLCEAKENPGILQRLGGLLRGERSKP